MYAKIFRQIFDSSIAENYELRHIFMDLLVLADQDGVIDKTPESIARTTNVPLEKVLWAIKLLSEPDPRSRNADENGARLKRLDDHRDWGWVIINYDLYRKMASDEQRREKTRLRTREYRGRLRANLLEKPTCDATVTHGDAEVTIPYTSAYACTCASEEKKSSEKPKSVYNLNVQRQVISERIQKLKNLSPRSESEQTEIRDEIRELKAKLRDVEKTICDQ